MRRTRLFFLLGLPFVLGSWGCISTSHPGGVADVGGTDAAAEVLTDSAEPIEVLAAAEVSDEVATVAETAPAEVTGGCGDGVCQPPESRTTCAADCGCGNGVCEGPETKINCAADCCAEAVCGNCACDAACGENLTNCPHDCYSCGDGIVSPGEIDCGCILDACRCPASGGSGCGDGCCMGSLCSETPGSCARDCGTGCGNGTCDPGETPNTCAEDCNLGACGNGICEANNQETPTTCAADCAAVCGNCACEFGETYLSCPADCGLCGDGVCSNCPALGERDHCAADCGIDRR
jgi:hypothetical protein